MNPGSP